MSITFYENKGIFSESEDEENFLFKISINEVIYEPKKFLGKGAHGAVYLFETANEKSNKSDFTFSLQKNESLTSLPKSLAIKVFGEFSYAKNMETGEKILEKKTGINMLILEFGGAQSDYNEEKIKYDSVHNKLGTDFEKIFPKVYGFFEVNVDIKYWIMISDIGEPIKKEMIKNPYEYINALCLLTKKMLILHKYDMYISDLKIDNIIKIYNDYYFIDIGSVCENNGACSVTYTNKTVALNLSGNFKNQLSHVNIAIFVLFTTLLSYLYGNFNDECYKNYLHFEKVLKNNCDEFFVKILDQLESEQNEELRNTMIGLIKKIIEIRNRAPYTSLEEINNDLIYFASLCDKKILPQQSAGGMKYIKQKTLFDVYKLEKYLYKYKSNPKDIYKMKINYYGKF